MHQLTLLSIHCGKRMTSRLLFALLGQLDQIGEGFIDALGQHRIAFGKAAQELRVLCQRLELRLRITRLQANSQATITLQQTTLIIAVQAKINIIIKYISFFSILFQLFCNQNSGKQWA